MKFRRLLTLGVVCLLVSSVHAQKLAVLHSFSGPDGATPYAAVIQDHAGNLYGTTFRGGRHGFGVVYKLAPNGRETVLHAFGPLPDAQNPFFGTLLRDKAGDLFGTTCCGGSGGRGDGTVFEITTKGQEKVLYSFQGAPGDGEGPNGGLTVDAQGNFYGTTYIGGTYGWGTVYELSAAGKETVLYNFAGTPDGANPYAESLVRDVAGNLFGMNYYDGAYGWGTIFEITPTGQEDILYNFPGAPGSFLAYSGLVSDENGNFYGVTEGGGVGCVTGCGTVFRLSSDGTFAILYRFQGRPDASEPFATLIRDTAGNLYGTTIAGGKYNHGAIFELSANGKETVLHSFNGKDGAEPFASLTMDSAGNLYGTTRKGGMKNKGVVFRLSR